MQLLSSAAFSLGHGGNDSQKKVMGIIAAAVPVYIHTSGFTQDMLPDWLMLAPNEDGDFKARMIPWLLFSYCSWNVIRWFGKWLRQWVRNYKK
jgi:PiT family inorganic phosphate transporter